MGVSFGEAVDGRHRRGRHHPERVEGPNKNAVERIFAVDLHLGGRRFRGARNERIAFGEGGRWDGSGKKRRDRAVFVNDLSVMR